MIQANELRIGNIVLRTKWLQRYCKKPETWEYKQIIVDANDILSCKLRPDYFKPVPINPERLEKCGFEIDELRCWGKINLPNSPNVLLINCGDGIGRGTVWLRNIIGSINLTSVYHMHRIQNLYFALTGKELNPSF